ncbi:MAG: nucleoside-diphosphate kinase [Helicobacter sp.]|nr:nucleoside-diphosphate kinase [Helicobacter sp.]
MEQTLSLIKPNAVSKNVIGKIISKFEENNLKIAAIKKLKLTKEEAEKFYAIHKDRPFFGDLVAFMTSGEILAIVLEGQDAVLKNREIMGATDPKNAKAGTIRAEFGDSIEANAVHGSDSLENAKNEIAFFFAKRDLH